MAAALRSARLNRFRLNGPGARLNVYTPFTGIYLKVNGIWTDYTQYARVASAAVTQALNEVPDTATIRFSAAIPLSLEGREIVFSNSGGNWDFSGNILAIRTLYEGKTSNVVLECDCIDFTWQLNAKKVTRRYTNQTGNAIISDLVAKDAPAGFYTSYSETFAVIDEITFTNEELGQAISRVCERLGLYWWTTYDKAVAVYSSPWMPSAGTIDQTHARQSSKLATHKDYVPIVTQVRARGGGAPAAVDVAPGSPTLPVEDASWYPPAGYVECGPQVIQYQGVSDPGTGALIGGGNAPTTAPTVNAATGTNLAAGATYLYAASYTTAAGETLPGAIASYLPVGGTVSPPPVPQVRDGGYPGGRMVPGGYYRWALEWVLAGGGHVPGPQTAPILVNANTWQVYIDPNWFAGAIRGVTVFRSTNGGGLPNLWADQGTISSGGGWAPTGLQPDGDLSQGPPISSGGGPTLLAATLQVPISNQPGITNRKIYRTVANGTQLKLVGTLAGNSATGFLDTVPDGSLGANAPTTDTSGILSTGQVPAGAASLLVTDISVFKSTGGWVRAGGLFLRYTGVSGAALVLAEPLPSSLSYGTAVLNAPHLTGLEPLGAFRSIVYPIAKGDEVFVFTWQWDNAAVSALANAIGGDGIREEFLTDGRLGFEELVARARALLALRKAPLVTVTWETRDPGVEVSKTITFNTTAPAISGTFVIQRVQIAEFPAKAHVHPVHARRVVEASSRRFTFDDLVQQIKLLGRIN
jgi:hypothetical protein